MSAPVFPIRLVPEAPEVSAAPRPGAAGPAWAASSEGRVDQWHPLSGAVRPDVRFRALCGGGRIAVRFDVRGDRFVRSVATEPQGDVWKDSCVEFFVQPEGAAGHFNFEIDAGGTLLASYIVDNRRLPEGGFADWAPLPPEWMARVAVRTSLPRVVDPPLAGPLDWCAELSLPLSLLAAVSGAPCEPRPGAEWRANFFHCGDETPSPRWGAWSGVGERLDFHQPGRFGVLRFV